MRRPLLFSILSTRSRTCPSGTIFLVGADTTSVCALVVFGQSLCVHTPVHKLLTATRTSVRTAGPLNPDPPLILAVESPRLAGRSSADDMDFGQGELPVSRLVRGGCVRSSGRCTLLLPWCRSPLGACLGLYRRRRAPLSPVRPYHWERQVDGGRRRFLFTFGRLGSGEKAVGAAGGRRGAQRSSARRRAVGAPQHGTGSSGRVLSSNASLPFHRWCCILDSQRMRDHRAPEGAGQTTQPLNGRPVTHLVAGLLAVQRCWAASPAAPRRPPGRRTEPSRGPVSVACKRREGTRRRCRGTVVLMALFGRGQL